MVGKVALGVMLGIVGAVLLWHALPLLGLLALAWLGLLIHVWQSQPHILTIALLTVAGVVGWRLAG